MVTGEGFAGAVVAGGLLLSPARPVPSRTAETTTADTRPPPTAAGQRDGPRGSIGGPGGAGGSAGSRGGGGVCVRRCGSSVQRLIESPDSHGSPATVDAKRQYPISLQETLREPSETLEHSGRECRT